MDRRTEQAVGEHLRVLIANESQEYLSAVAAIVANLGHEVIIGELEINQVTAVTTTERPDVALIGLSVSPQHTLDLIEETVSAAACPVILLLHGRDPEFVKAASRRGIFAQISDDGLKDWELAIDIAFRRFIEFQSLREAFGRRSTIERAKGILMERHRVSEEEAFAMLREYSRTTNRKLIEIAAAVVDGHHLLTTEPLRAPAPVPPRG